MFDDFFMRFYTWKRERERTINLMSPKIHLNKKAITVRIIVITFVNTSEITIASK